MRAYAILGAKAHEFSTGARRSVRRSRFVDGRLEDPRIFVVVDSPGNRKKNLRNRHVAARRTRRRKRVARLDKPVSAQNRLLVSRKSLSEVRYAVARADHARSRGEICSLTYRLFRRFLCHDSSVSSGNALRNLMVGNIASHNSSCADQSSFAYSDSRQNDGTTSNRSSSFHPRSYELPIAFCLQTAIDRCTRK